VIVVARWKTVCELGLRLPEVEEGTSFGRRALRVRGSLLAQLQPDKRSVVVKVGPDRRAALCARDPATFSVTPEVASYGLVVRLASVDEATLRDLLGESWRRSAPPSLVARYEGGG
jgi:hypothetical protein